jgi:hypothetical protein
MANYSVAGILRAANYSPNHIASDAAVLNEVCARLRKRGCDVTVYSEAELLDGKVTEPVIINMCRDTRSLRMLREMEDAGALVINSAYAVENCRRERLGRLLRSADVAYPTSILTDTDASITAAMLSEGMTRCWVKRADAHSMHKEDITFAPNPAEAQDVVNEYFLRGIRCAVVDRHLEGNLVKFYGVRGSNFFHWYYPFDRQQNATGHDATDGRSPVFSFSSDNLKAIASRAANALGVDIYGGDAIVDATGEICIVNFNDWPSFAPCRAEAVNEIARFISAAIKQKFNPKQKKPTAK